jgi:hypothetical protein
MALRAYGASSSHDPFFNHELLAQIFRHGERLRRRISLLVVFVFIRDYMPDIRGSRTSKQDGQLGHGPDAS